MLWYIVVQIYISKSGSHLGTLGHIGEKYTFAKVGHIGKMRHMGAQIYICKSGAYLGSGAHWGTLVKVGH